LLTIKEEFKLSSDFGEIGGYPLLSQKKKITAGIFKVSRSSSVPPSTRDALYQGLPPGIKSALRSRLQTFEIKEEVTFLFNFFSSYDFLDQLFLVLSQSKLLIFKS
jgi:Protein of unknown function (DUF668)